MLRMMGLLFVATLMIAGTVVADSDPILARQQLMEETRDAAKLVGGMLRGQQEFEATAAMEAFSVWANTAEKVGVLFPEDSRTGHDTEAKASVWTDRAGFDEELEKFAAQVKLAQEANPDSLEALKAAAGPVFQVCKSCHEGYRVEKED